VNGPLQRRGLPWLLAVAVFVAGALALYANGLHGPFHYDDHHGIVDNPYLRDLGNIPEFFTSTRYFSPSEPTARHYRPLLLASYALNFSLGGESPVGFHVYNALLHAAGSLVLAALALALGLPAPLAWGAGLLFLAHPLNTEAVDYASARSSLQSGVFTLLALYGFIRFRRAARRGGIWLGISLAAAAVAVLSKEVAVVIPALYVLYDLLYPPPRGAWRSWRGYGMHGAFFAVGTAVLVASGHLTYFLKMAMGKVNGPRGVFDNLWLQAQVLVDYVRLTVFPVGLSIVHDFHGAAAPTPASIGAAVGLIGVTALAVRFARAVPGAALGWFLFLIVLAPTTILPMNTPLQESRAYAAMAGLVLAVAALLARFAHEERPSRAQVAAGMAVLALFAVGTVARNPVWGSDLSLWSDAVQKAPGDFRAHANLGAAYHASGDLETAVTEYRKAIEIFPGEASVHSDLGGALLELGRPGDAWQSLTTAIRLSKRYAPAHYKFGLLLDRGGDLKGAREEYEKAVKLVPTYAEALVNLGILLARTGDLDGAVARMEQARAVRPGDPAIYVNLMIALRQKGDIDAAGVLYRQAQANRAVSPQLDALWRAVKPGLP
jgi:Flp pilus assembly protein TadD